MPLRLKRVFIKVNISILFLHFLITHVGALSYADSFSLDSDYVSADGTVYAITSDSNYVYYGGDFSDLGYSVGSGMALNSATGALQSEYPFIPSGGVSSVVPDGNGGWYIGGAFYGSSTFHYLSHIQSDGTLDPWYVDPDLEVTSLAISGDYLYVGGLFTEIADEQRSYLVRFNINTGALDESWNPNINSYVSALYVQDGFLYAGGSFTQIGAVTRNRIARFDLSTGALDSSWDPNANNSVYALAGDSSGIYIAGDFTQIGGTNRNRLAKLNDSTGSLDLTWNPDPNFNVSVIATSGDNVYVGGGFTSIGGISINYLAKLNNTTGAADASWNPNANSSVESLEVDGNFLYVGGDFTSIAESDHIRVAKLHLDTAAIDSSWKCNSNGTVKTIVTSGESMYIGGTFTLLQVTLVPGLGRVNKVTKLLDTSWVPYVEGTVYSIERVGDSLYVGGAFTTVNSTGRRNVVKISTLTGSVDSSWNPNANGTVRSLEIADGYVYAGGSFTSIGGQTRNRIARLDTTSGAADTGWNPNSTGTVLDIEISGSDVYASGSFTSIGGQTRNRIAKLNNTTGAADASWNPNAGGTVNSITLYDNNLYLAGAFSTVGGNSLSRVARVSASTGTVDSAWNPNSGGTVNTIYVDNGNVYIGGLFSTVGGQSRNRVALIKAATGLVDANWNPNAAGTVNVIYKEGNDIYLGGSFTSVSSNTAATQLAHLEVDSEAPAISVTPLSPDPNADSTPTFSGTATDSVGVVAGVSFQVDSTAGSWNTCVAADGTFDESSEVFTCTSITALADGSHTVYFQATDDTGNVTLSGSEASDTFSVDTTAPSIPGTPTTASPNGSTTPTWTWDASTDLLAGLHPTQPYTVQWCDNSGFTGCDSNVATSETTSFTHSTALNAGTWYLRVLSTDAVGNASSYTSYGEVLIDTQVPVGSILINSGDAYTNNSQVSLTISASDDNDSLSGIQMQISNLSDLSDASWEAVTPTRTWTLSDPNTDGTKTIFARFRDSVNNTSGIYTFTIIYDTKSPKLVGATSEDVGKFVINSSDKTVHGESKRYTNTRKIKLYFDTKDTVSKQSKMKISQYKDFYGASWQDYQSKTTFDLTDIEGSKHVYVKFKDKAGNISKTYSRSITLDKTDPVITLKSISGETYSQEQIFYTTQSTPEFKGIATDSNPVTVEIFVNGVSSYLLEEHEISLDGSYSLAKSVFAPGRYNIRLEAKDAAGNTSGLEFILVVSI